MRSSATNLFNKNIFSISKPTYVTVIFSNKSQSVLYIYFLLTSDRTLDKEKTSQRKILNSLNFRPICPCFTVKNILYSIKQFLTKKLLCFYCNILLEREYPKLKTAVMGNDKFRRLGGCFGMGMGHQVRDNDIFLGPIPVSGRTARRDYSYSLDYRRKLKPAVISGVTITFF